jgi:hypothetical protein
MSKMVTIVLTLAVGLAVGIVVGRGVSELAGGRRDTDTHYIV